MQNAVCIDSCLLGTNKHLVCSPTGHSWCESIPNDVWHLSGVCKDESDACFDTLMQLQRIVIDVLPPRQFVDMMRSVAHDRVSIPWKKVLPKGVHRRFVENIIEQAMVALDVADTNYYVNTWVPGSAVLRSLQRARTNQDRVDEIVATRCGNSHVVETFRPDFTGYAEHIKYNRFGTLTGRLTVAAGPQILTLKKEYRNVLVPSDPDGQIMYVDFASLEARVLLYEAGRRCDDHDLYAMLAMSFKVPRNIMKHAVISELYGSSKRELEKTTGLKGKELKEFIMKVKTYFNTRELLKRVKDEFIAKGDITNRYGRKVSVDEPLDRIFVNYYAQSTGVDVALLGFNAIISDMRTDAPGVRPLFVLHDALIVDVPKQHLEYVDKIDAVYVPGYVQAFPVRTESISCTQ